MLNNSIFSIISTKYKHDLQVFPLNSDKISENLILGKFTRIIIAFICCIFVRWYFALLLLMKAQLMLTSTSDAIPLKWPGSLGSLVCYFKRAFEMQAPGRTRENWREWEQFGEFIDPWQAARLFPCLTFFKAQHLGMWPCSIDAAHKKELCSKSHRAQRIKQPVNRSSERPSLSLSVFQAWVMESSGDADDPIRGGCGPPVHQRQLTVSSDDRDWNSLRQLKVEVVQARGGEGAAN